MSSPTVLSGRDVELLDVGQVARLLNCSQRHVFRLAEADRMPAPVRLGSLVRWRRVQILAWVDEGCPAEVRRRQCHRG